MKWFQNNSSTKRLYGNKQSGYSLLQTSFALIVMGILVAVLVPRMIEIVGEARDAKVKAVGSGFKAAVFLSREAWYAGGKTQGALKNFGQGNLIMSELGWPVNVTDGTDHADAQNVNQKTEMDKTRMGHEACRDIWRALLVEGAPAVALQHEEQPSTEFIAEMDGGVCRYRYIEDDASRFIEYNPANGRITWQIR